MYVYMYMWTGCGVGWKRCVFSTLRGLRLGRARRSSGEAQRGEGCFNWTQCTVTAVGAGGHRVQHSSRALSVYMTATAWGRWQLCITITSYNSHRLPICPSSSREIRMLYSVFLMLKSVQAWDFSQPLHSECTKRSPVTMASKHTQTFVCAVMEAQ